jgi:hypothetical protein
MNSTSGWSGWAQARFMAVMNTPTVATSAAAVRCRAGEFSFLLIEGDCRRYQGQDRRKGRRVFIALRFHGLMCKAINYQGTNCGGEIGPMRGAENGQSSTAPPGGALVNRGDDGVNLPRPLESGWVPGRSGTAGSIIPGPSLHGLRRARERRIAGNPRLSYWPRRRELVLPRCRGFAEY